MPPVSVKLSDDRMERAVLFSDHVLLNPSPYATQAGFLYLAAILTEILCILLMQQ
jgi:hypothetical protein